MNRIDDLAKQELQQQLKANFREDGFIFFPSFLDTNEIEEVKANMTSFIQNKVPAMPTEMVYYEDHTDKETLKQLQRLFVFDDFFHQMMFKSRFEYLAGILLDDDVIGKNIQYFNKPPQIGKPTPPHQDGYYFMLTPNEALTMWLALEDVDEENGCVRYVKGSHRDGMRPHGRTKTLGFSQGITDFGKPTDLEREVYFPTKAGDLLVHHSLTIHWAEGNTSAVRSRKAMGFIYYAEKAKENRAAHEAYARRLAAELAKSNQIG